MAMSDWLGRPSAESPDPDLDARSAAQLPHWRDPINQPDSTADILRDIGDPAIQAWARQQGRNPSRPGTPDTREGIEQRGRATYVPPPVTPTYRADADYPSDVLKGTRVVPAQTPAPTQAPDTTQFQARLVAAQQVAVEQVRAQQQAEMDAAERLASAALGQYIAPTRAQAPARSVHR
jgi:hypothetical protein